VKNLKVKRLHSEAKMPTRAYRSNGIDIYALGNHCISPGETKIIPTGIAIALEPGYVAVIFDRSSIGAKGITTFHEMGILPADLEQVPFAGVIDSDYRGQIGCVLHNFSHDPFTINHGDKMAQLLIWETEMPELQEIEEFEETTERGAGGFGSSDRPQAGSSDGNKMTLEQAATGQVVSKTGKTLSEVAKEQKKK